jgi:hypothetical protein
MAPLPPPVRGVRGAVWLGVDRTGGSLDWRKKKRNAQIATRDANTKIFVRVDCIPACLRPIRYRRYMANCNWTCKPAAPFISLRDKRSITRNRRMPSSS